MKVCEIFASIQGESSFSGYPCVFIRLTGCNLRCSYCDTTYAYEDGTDLKLDEVIRKVRAFGLRLVEVTGGEPLLQKESFELMSELLAGGYKVLLETNGSFDISGVDSRVSVILDMKCPSSGMNKKMYMENLAMLSEKDDIKFVLGTKEDYEWAGSVIEKYSLLERTNVLFSPVVQVLAPSKVAAWMIADKLHCRLNLQLHKYIFDPGKRGV